MGIRQVVAGVLVVTALIGAAAAPGRAAAAPPAQGGRLSFDDTSPTPGTLDAATPQVSYTFACFQDGIGSVAVHTTSGDLAVDITVIDPSSRPFASGRVVSTNPNIAAAEAFVMPADGQCAVTLARSGSTSGAYEIRLLPGYAGLDVWDTFDNNPNDPLQLTWAPYKSDTMQVNTVNGQLRMDVTTDNLLGYAEPTADALNWSDYYIQADFTILDSPSYFEYGFVMRVSSDVETFYSLTCSSDGDWTFYFYDGSWQAIQDWTVSPVIDGTDKNPRLSVFLQGDTFRLYFNNRFVAEVTDPNNYASEGSLALAASTGVDQTDPLAVLFDNLVITVPLAKPSTLPFGGFGTPEPTPTTAGIVSMFGATKPPSPPTPTTFVPTLPPPPTNTPESPFPATLRSWSGSTADIVAELVRAGLVPSGGSQQINVPSSYGDTSSAGLSFYPLGQGRTFRDFVLAFDARLVMTGPESGCGMYFRNATASSNSALVTEDGAFLLGEWDSSGNLTDSSVLDVSDAVIAGQGSTNRVIVVADGSTVLMYVNGQLVASATDFTPASGSLALEMYVASNDAGQTVETYCQLNNIWLWAF